MSIDIDAILKEFISLARDGVGGSLSTIGPSGNTAPAVIKARQDGPLPDYPYVVVDILDISRGGWLLNESVDDNDNPFYETTYTLLMNYRCYGGNSIEIIHELEGFFRFPRVRDEIRSTIGGALVDTDSVDTLPVLNSTEFLESASFNFTYSITDTLVDTSTGIFDTVILDSIIGGIPKTFQIPE